MVTPKFVSASCTFDNENIDVKNVVVVTCQSGLNINEKSGYEKVKLKAEKI